MLEELVVPSSALQFASLKVHAGRPCEAWIKWNHYTPPQRLVTIVVPSQGLTKLLFLVECFGSQTGSASVGTEIHKPGKSGLYHGKLKELSAKVHSCHHHRLESVWKCIHPWPASPTFYIVCISCISHAFPWPRLLCRRHPTSRIGKLCLEAMPMPVNDVPGKPVFRCPIPLAEQLLLVDLGAFSCWK